MFMKEYSPMLYDLFICHASEDKESFVQPLAEALRAEHVEVWYDEFSLKLGDSIRQSIDKGLRQSRFGVVVLSKAFFSKNWPQYELDGLTEKEMAGRDKVMLPVWHGVTHRDVLEFSPPLANRQAISSDKGIQKVIQAVLRVVRPQGSPLIVARDTLLEWRADPPVITDEYWLHVVEASNRVPGFGLHVPKGTVWGRWSFPLPDKEGGPRQWGERLAWTAMQLEWVTAAEKIPVSLLSRPTDVIQFIDAYPGLHETCEVFPELLVEYAPQLTIPGMNGPFEELFEKLYQDSIRQRSKMRREGSVAQTGLTTTGEGPLCDAKWALRHPTFGDWQPQAIAREYFMGDEFGPPVSPYEHIDHAVWLLSLESGWLPDKIHTFLLDGMAAWHAWPSSWGSVGCNWSSCYAFSDALFSAKDGKAFRWTKRVRDDAIHRFEMAIKTLGLPESSEEILERFRDHDFPGKFILSEKQRKARREGHPQ
jgi:hypothetical protein